MYSKTNHFYKVKTWNGLSTYPAKYHSKFYFEHYFSAPIRQEMLYKEYWDVI